MDDIGLALERQIMTAARNYTRAVDAEMVTLGISQARWQVLYWIANAPNATQNELAALVGVRRPSLIGLLKALGEDALVEYRWSHLQSRMKSRTKSWQLTADGEAKYRALDEVIKAFRTRLIEGICADRLRVTIETLEEVQSHLVLAEGPDEEGHES